MEHKISDGTKMGDIIQCINSLINPLKDIIFTYIPKNIQMRLCKYNRGIQAQLDFSILTYKYHHFLSRHIPIELNKNLQDFVKKLKLHHIDYFNDELSKALLLQRFLSLKKKYTTTKEKDLNNSFELYLLENIIPYLMISNQEEYDLLNTYSLYFQNTKLFIVDVEEGKNIIQTFIQKTKYLSENVMIIKTKQICYLDYISNFPHIICLIRKSYSYYTKECDFFNIFHDKLLLLNIYLWKRDNLANVNLSHLKHLSIKLSKYVVEAAHQPDHNNLLDIKIPFLHNDFKQLISLSIYQAYFYDENMAAIDISLTNDFFPRLEHLYIKVNKLNASPRIDIKTLKTISLKTNFSSKVILIVPRGLVYFDCQYVNNNLQLEFNEGEYCLRKFKTCSSLGLINTTFPSLKHLHLYITDQTWVNLREFMKKVSPNLISLKLNWHYITDNKAINDIFYYEYTALKKLKVNFPKDLEQKVFDLIIRKILIERIRIIKFHFYDNTEVSISDKIIENLMKFTLNKLQCLECNNLHKSVKAIIHKNMPSLRKLSIMLNNNDEEELFEACDIVYPFFKNNHSKLECLKLYNKSFQLFANYSLALFPRLNTFYYSKENDVFNTSLPSIENNRLSEKRDCSIF